MSSSIMHFTLPASFLIFFFGLLIYTGVFFIARRNLLQLNITPEMLTALGRGSSVELSALSPSELTSALTVFSAQTALTTFFVLSGILLMIFAAPPTKWLAGGSPYSGNWMPTIAAGVLIAAYGVILQMPGLRNFFDLVDLPISINVGIIAITALWFFSQLAVWRSNLFERFLDLEVEGEV